MKLCDVLDGNRKSKNFSCIYLWKNLINGKVYIGQTQNFYKRMCQYKNGNDKDRVIGKALNKYGFDNFDISIIEECPIDKLGEREQYWMDYYHSYDVGVGYNICREAGTTRGYRHTDEAKKKMSDAGKANSRPLYGEANPMYGKKHDDGWRKEHSEWLKNKWETDDAYRKFWSDKMSGENNYFYGKHMTGELNPRWGTHCSEESKQKAREHHPFSTAVICVETGEEFLSINQAAKHFGGKTSNISIVLDNPNRTYKKHHFIRKNK